MENQSAEEVFKSISAAPITNYMDIEIYPLADGFGIADSMIVRNAKAGGKNDAWGTEIAK